MCLPNLRDVDIKQFIYINFLKIDFACVKFRGQVQIQIVYKYVLSVCSDF